MGALANLRWDAVALAKTLLSVRQGPLAAKRAYIDRYGERLRLSGAQGRTLAGTLYQPRGLGPRPGMLLLHGSTPAGRRLGMYRLLGRALAARGYLVLAIDQRGFGESQGPLRVERPEDLDFVHDAQIALRYLGSLPGVDAGQLSVVGHSFGADVALSAAMGAGAAAKLVLIGPGRRYAERARSELGDFIRRTSRYMRLKSQIPRQLYARTVAALPLEFHLDAITGPGHKPILLIDGELEPAADRRFLRELYAAMAEPKAIVTLPQADHYANIGNFGRLVIYDGRTAGLLVDTIDRWLRGAGVAT